MSDSSWDILGITPTNDESAIKKAYAKQLKHNKPDKNPAGFRRLRAAYEQALATRHYYQNISINIHIDSNNVNDNNSNNDDKNDNDDKKDFDTKTNESHHNDVNDKVQVISPSHNNTPALNQDTGTDNTETPAQQLPIEFALNETEQIESEQIESEQIESATDETPLAPQPVASYSNQQEINLPQDILIDDAQTIVQWQAEWHTILEQYTNIDSNKTNSSQRKYYVQADKALRNCLADQFKALTSLSLDTRLDYEIALFIWFEAQPPLFISSYRYASKFFDWNRYINGLDSREYPWFLMRPVYERYIQTSNFNSKETFKSYLAYHYPLVHQVWNYDIGYLKAPNRLKLLTFLYTNQPLPLLQQLEALEYELTNYSNQSQQYDSMDKEHDWLTHPQFIALKQRVNDSFFSIQDVFTLVFIAILLTALWWLITRAPWPALTFFYDTMGVYVILLFGFAFWQLQLHLFTKPYRFVISTYTSFEKVLIYRWWRNFSIIIWLSSCFIYNNINPTALLISTPDTLNGDTITIPFTMSYFAGHIAGLSMLVALNAKSDTTITIQLYWYMGLILFILAAILQPFDLITSTGLSRDFSSTTPIFWGLLVLPLVLDQLAIKLSRLRFILTMLSVWLTGAWVFFAILVFLGVIAVSIEVFSNLNLVATLITWMMMLVFLVGYLVTNLNQTKQQLN